jgi:hypothetical protein
MALQRWIAASDSNGVSPDELKRKIGTLFACKFAATRLLWLLAGAEDNASSWRFESIIFGSVHAGESHAGAGLSFKLPAR